MRPVIHHFWKIPLIALAAAYFVVDAIFGLIAHPIANWLGRVRILERARRWVTSLGRYASLALFAVPLILLEPAKPLAGYLAATGHWISGASVFVVAELLKLTCVERLFHLNRHKLLSIPAFAWGYGHWRRAMDFVESLEAWKLGHRMILQSARWIRAHWFQFRRAQRWQYRWLRQ